MGQGGQEGLVQSLVLELELLGELVAVLAGSSCRSSWSENGLRTKATAASCLPTPNCCHSSASSHTLTNGINTVFDDSAKQRNVGEKKSKKKITQKPGWPLNLVPSGGTSGATLGPPLIFFLLATDGGHGVEHDHQIFQRLGRVSLLHC